MPANRPSTAAARPADDKPLLLLVDDDPLIVDTLSFTLQRHYRLIQANSRQSALNLLDQEPHAPDIALIDLGLPPEPHRPSEGFRLIQELLGRLPELRILALSGQSDERNARHARTLGALDFIAKPCDPASLLKNLERALRFKPLSSGENQALIGNSPALQKLQSQLAQYADLPFPVLIDGESGCGKEIIARHYLHAATQRADLPFLALNCAAISPSLVEPTLFGHAKGAFTGATGARAGYFEEVGKGTLFLDEVGELPLELQAKLLRVLENGEFQRVGETQTRRASARIVTATNRDLRNDVREGRFRNDLYHRLSVFSVHAPALREMDDDRFLLLDHFCQHYAELAGQKPFWLDTAAQAAWAGYSFPGNVRELKNITIRLVARHGGQAVTRAMLDSELDPQADEIIGPLNSATGSDRPVAAQSGEPIDWAQWASQTLQNNADFNLDRTLQGIAHTLIDQAIALNDGNISQAAKQLGISRTTLYSRMDNKGRQ